MRLPIPSQDKNSWGEILNSWLRVAHNDDGTLTDAVKDNITAGLAEEADLVSLTATVEGVDTATAQVASRVFDIRDYEATANNPAIDNIPFINAAIAACSAAGGGEVFMPPGTWWISPTTTSWIEGRSNVTLSGPRSARIKVSATAGDYKYLFSGVGGPSVAIQNFSVQGVTIDHNASGNTGCNVTLTNGQATFRFDSFVDIRFVRVRLQPYTGVNAFQLFGGSTDSSVVSIEDCDCTFERGASSTLYDTSGVYASARDVTVARNKFRFLGSTDYPAGGIEVHGPNQSVTGNIVEGFTVGTWLVPETSAAMTKPTFAAICTGNTYIRVGVGVGLLSSNPAKVIRQVIVSNNNIHVDSTIHERITFGGVLMSGDTGWAAAEDVMITDNNILFATGETRTTTATGATIIWDVSGGVVVSCPTTQTARNIIVAGNSIKNAPNVGIRLLGVSGATLEDVWIHHNKIIDAGLNTALGGTLRSGVVVTGAANFRRSVIEDNWVIDTGASALNGSYAYRSASLTGTDKDLTFRRNYHQAVTGTLLQLLNADMITHEATVSLDFPSIAAATTSELTVTVKDARVGDIAFASPANGLNVGLSWSAYVSATNTVTVRVANVTASAIDPTSRAWYVAIHRRQA